jgi:transcriptional regulator with XRE-family HTH domain
MPKRKTVERNRKTTPKQMQPVYRLLGAKIEQIRTTLGMSQEDLSKRIGTLNRPSIANIEAGRQRVLLHDVEAFAAAFGISPKQLLRGIWL